jgi:hypothetical protein
MEGESPHARKQARIKRWIDLVHRDFLASTCDGTALFIWVNEQNEVQFITTITDNAGHLDVKGMVHLLTFTAFDVQRQRFDEVKNINMDKPAQC